MISSDICTLVTLPLSFSFNDLIFEPPNEKTNNLHMRQQRRRTASQ